MENVYDHQKYMNTGLLKELKIIMKEGFDITESVT